MCLPIYARRASRSKIIRRGTCAVRIAATTSPTVFVSISQADHFGFRPKLEAVASALPAEAALARSAEGRAQVAQEEAVDPYHPGLEPRRNSQRAIDARGPYVAR